jgi:hypothetical protein
MNGEPSDYIILQVARSLRRGIFWNENYCFCNWYNINDIECCADSGPDE